MSSDNRDTIAILDFGGQYTHLIANRIRRLGVYSEIVSCDIKAADLQQFKGIIFSGSPHSVLEPKSPSIDPDILKLNLPILGLCYGHQLLSKLSGGTVCKGDLREYGKAQMSIVKDSPLFEGCEKTEQIWMSHGDAVSKLADNFETIGSTEDCEAAAVANEKEKKYGLQFHPEVTDTPNGQLILDNFLKICNCKKQWNSDSFLNVINKHVLETAKGRNVFLLVSGGVDSTVAFALLNNLLGPDRVLGLHIDNGLMRHNESMAILDYLNEHGFHNLKIVNATDDFLQALDGVADPEKKREIIGKMFLTIKEQEFDKLGLDPEEWILAQGTIYPDTIESAGTKHADKIKTHHNRVESILELLENGNIVEPLAQLYKDEVRILGERLGIPYKLLWRHPFPGPGLGVRVLCSDGKDGVISENVSTAVQQITKSFGYDSVVLPIRSVGVQGDGRTYAHPVLVSGPRNWDTLETVSTKLTNSQKAINRVIYLINAQGNMQYNLIEGYVTQNRLDKLREIDHIVTEALYQSGEYDKIWQMPVVLLPLVNEFNNECVVLRPIMSQEAMTARFVPLQDSTLQTIIAKAKQIEGIGDIFFDITHKPPGTIEWE